MKEIFKKIRPELIALILIAAAVRFWQLYTPSSVVFDEVYFKVFAGHYLDHKYFFDIHPPFVKLLLAGWANLLNIPIVELVSKTQNTVELRILPALAGTLIIPVFWALLRKLGVNRKLSFIGALALALDNALIVESRMILMDSLLLLFGLVAIWSFICSRTEKKSFPWLLLAGLSSGAAVSTKWTGLTAFGIIGLICLYDAISQKYKIKTVLFRLAVITLLSLSVYVSTFAIHFSLLNQSGDGDAFMSPQFQEQLQGNPTFSSGTKLSFLDKFIELNKVMYTSNKTLTASHPYGSKWYTWPLELRTIYYWQGDTQSDGDQGNIYLLGNPFVWWGVIISIVTGFVIVVINRIKLSTPTIKTLVLLGAAYLANFLPFVGVTRVMFLYHYLFSFILSVGLAIALWDGIIKHINKNSTFDVSFLKAGYAIVLIGIIGCFIYFAPLTYGTPLSPSDMNAKFWLTSWR